MRALLITILAITFCAPAYAVLVEVNPDAVQIREFSPGANFEPPNINGQLLNADNFEGVNEIRSLLRADDIFNAGNVPAGATIDSAVLSLDMVNGSTEVHNIHQVITPWAESTVTWNSFNMGGAAGSDYVATPGGSFTPGSVSGNRDIDVTSIVQAWSNGDANEGFLLVASGGDGSSYRSDDVDPLLGAAPKLTINYSTAAIPEPSSFALFGLVAGGYGIKRWKKRKQNS